MNILQKIRRSITSKVKQFCCRRYRSSIVEDPFDVIIDPSNYTRPEKGDKLFIEPSDDAYHDKVIIGRFREKSDYLIITGFYEVAISSLRALKTKVLEIKIRKYILSFITLDIILN